MNGRAVTFIIEHEKKKSLIKMHARKTREAIHNKGPSTKE
jgi:hypothetical protein